jgi:prepilin peptidase CpaA
LILLLLLAVIYDQRERRIPNILILVGLFLAGGWNLYAQGLSGLLFSLQGLLAGLALLFIPFAMGGMGAGDVKLLALVGAFKGAAFAFYSFIFMALWGGLIAVGILLLKGQFKKTLLRLWTGTLLALSKVQKMSISLAASNSGVSFPYALSKVFHTVNILKPSAFYSH